MARPSAERAVRVYTVNDESRYVEVRNIPAIGVVDEALKKLSLYGDIVAQRSLAQEPNDFTESLWVAFETVNNARHAKNRMKHKQVYGSILDVTYAPQYETPEDTASKLRERRELLERRAAPRQATRGTTTERTRSRPVEEHVVDPEFIGPQLPSRRPVVVVHVADTIAPPPPPPPPQIKKRRRI